MGDADRDELFATHTPALQAELEKYWTTGVYPADGGCSPLSPKPPGQYPKFTFRTLTPKHEHKSHALDRLGELAFVQWAVLEAFPEANKIGSCLHAGPGQRVWGGFSGDRIDFSGHIAHENRMLFYNYHEAGIHYDGHCQTSRRIGRANNLPCVDDNVRDNLI